MPPEAEPAASLSRTLACPGSPARRTAAGSGRHPNQCKLANACGAHRLTVKAGEARQLEQGVVALLFDLGKRRRNASCVLALLMHELEDWSRVQQLRMPPKRTQPHLAAPVPSRREAAVDARAGVEEIVWAAGGAVAAGASGTATGAQVCAWGTTQTMQRDTCRRPLPPSKLICPQCSMPHRRRCRQTRGGKSRAGFLCAPPPRRRNSTARMPLSSGKKKKASGHQERRRGGGDIAD